jgi:mannose-6-phosphate isomerase-like protein (cupin superfamily)
MSLKNTYLTLAVALLASHAFAAGPSSEVVAYEEVDWGFLNPLRGELSPGAADLWGDRGKDRATGMLVRFDKGFASPPHIHNISYRGVVITGLMHNDDPAAAKTWMPTGSFWTQPAGADHITAANGEENLIYLEIDSGPYRVKPSAEQFDNGERAINLHADNLVWLGKSESHRIDAEGVETSFLWGGNGRDRTDGTLLKLPAGFDGTIAIKARDFRAVVIEGNLGYRSSETSQPRTLAAGSYFGSTGNFQHTVSTLGAGALLYVRSDGRYRVTSIRIPHRNPETE